MSVKEFLLAEKAKLDQLGEVYVAQAEALDAELKAERDAGFDEGVAQSGTPGDKIYTEADLQAELTPLKDKIAALDQKMLDLEAAHQVAVSEAVDAKADEIAREMENVAIDNDMLVKKYKKN